MEIPELGIAYLLVFGIDVSSANQSLHYILVGFVLEPCECS